MKSESSVRKSLMIEIASMEWPSALLKFLIIVLFFANVTSVNYVKPLERKESEKASPCSKVQRPCLTLNEYARGSDDYFVNNTRFYFYPGIHRLDYSVNLAIFHSWVGLMVIR